jgi:hypothetical protein
MRIAGVSGFFYRWTVTTVAGIEAELVGGQYAEIYGSALTARGLPSDGPG